MTNNDERVVTDGSRVTYNRNTGAGPTLPVHEAQCLAHRQSWRELNAASFTRLQTDAMCS